MSSNKLFTIYDQGTNIDKTVSDLIYITSNAGSNLGSQKHNLKLEMEKKA